MKSSLTCTASNCVNNAGGFCVATAITVEGIDAIAKEETCCAEFALNNFINSVKELGNTNYVGILKQSVNFEKYPMKPEISCSARNCVHNNNAICKAHAVEIYGPNASSTKNTECNSFEIYKNKAISSDYI